MSEPARSRHARQLAETALVRIVGAYDIVGETRTALDDLASNFASSDAQGPQAYAETMLGLHPACLLLRW